MKSDAITFYYRRPEMGVYQDRFAPFEFFEIVPVTFRTISVRADTDREPPFPNLSAGDERSLETWLAWYACQSQKVRALDRQEAQVMASNYLQRYGGLTRMGELPSHPPCPPPTNIHLELASKEELADHAAEWRDHELEKLSWSIAYGLDHLTIQECSNVQELARGLLKSVGHCYDFPTRQTHYLKKSFVPSASMKHALQWEIDEAHRDAKDDPCQPSDISMISSAPERLGIPFTPMTKSEFIKERPDDNLLPIEAVKYRMPGVEARVSDVLSVPD